MAGTFSLQLAEFARKTKDKADDAVGLIVVKVAAELDQRSPVGDASYWKSPPPKGYIGGHFRANWQLGVDVRPAGERPGVDPSGERTQGAIIAEVPAEAAGRVFWLVNNVPYAQRLEHGYSRQAPQGMVGLTAIMFQQIVDEAVAALP